MIAVAPCRATRKPNVVKRRRISFRCFGSATPNQFLAPVPSLSCDEGPLAQTRGRSPACGAEAAGESPPFTDKMLTRASIGSYAQDTHNAAGAGSRGTHGASADATGGEGPPCHTLSFELPSRWPGGGLVDQGPNWDARPGRAHTMRGTLPGHTDVTARFALISRSPARSPSLASSTRPTSGARHPSRRDRSRRLVQTSRTTFTPRHGHRVVRDRPAAAGDRRRRGAPRAPVPGRRPLLVRHRAGVRRVRLAPAERQRRRDESVSSSRSSSVSGSSPRTSCSSPCSWTLSTSWTTSGPSPASSTATPCSPPTRSSRSVRTIRGSSWRPPPPSGSRASRSSSISWSFSR